MLLDVAPFLKPFSNNWSNISRNPTLGFRKRQMNLVHCSFNIEKHVLIEIALLFD